MISRHITQKIKQGLSIALVFFFMMGVFPFGKIQVASAAGEKTITVLEVKNNLAEAREHAPVSWSVPLSLGENVTDLNTLHLYRGAVEIPAQFTPISRWGGTPSDTTKPLMWVLIDATFDFAASESISLKLMTGPATNFPESPLKIVRNDDLGITLETGSAIYEISKNNFRFFDSVTLSDGTRYEGNGGIFLNGVSKASSASIVVEHIGLNRISLKVKGTIEGGLEYTSRMHFYKNLSEVKVDFRLENANQTPTTEFGQPQANNYGSRNSVNFDDLSIVIPGINNTSYTIPRGEMGSDGVSTGIYNESLVITQESSGDANWNVYKNRGYDARLQSGVTQRPSSLTLDGARQNGPNQIAGWLDANGVTIAVEHAWQNFPKSFRAQNNALEIGLFPSEYSKNHELRAGEFKTHTFWIRHHAASAQDISQKVKSYLSPLRFLPPVEYTATTEAAGIFAPRNESEFANYDKAIDCQLNFSSACQTGDAYSESGATSLLDSLSKAQMYGWGDYGNLPLDFEKTYITENGNSVGLAFTPFNLKYDALRGMIFQALRNPNNETWWELARSGAVQSADSNMQHASVRGYNSNRAWFEGGMYGHGYHNEDGRLNPGRNMMNPSTSMAGPGPGMILWALMTGDTLLLESGIELADNLYWKSAHSNYESDASGAANIARAVGLQQCSGDACSGYEKADGNRGGGNLVGTMQLAYMATGDRAYLDMISSLSNYLQRMEVELLGGIASCDRHSFQTTFIRGLGQYLVLRDQLGMSIDSGAKQLLERRMADMTGRLWNEASGRVYMCYDGGSIRPDNYSGDWQLGAADAFAAGALALNRPDLVTNYGKRVFTYAINNPAWDNSGLEYNATKDFVNQVGFGNVFLAAYKKFYTEVTPTPVPEPTPVPVPEPTPTPTTTPTPTPEPSPAPSIVLEAESMPVKSGTNVVRLPTDVAFYTNGYIQQSVNIPKTGNYAITVRAKADLVSGRNANLRFSLAGKGALNKTVNTATYTDYTFTKTLNAGNNNLRFAFTNDYYGGRGKDLNIYIDKVSIVSLDPVIVPAPVPEPTPTPTTTPTPTPAPTSTPSVQHVVLNATADTFLFPGYGNIGALDSLRFYRGQSDDYTSRVLLKFDTSLIPANATINSASLELYHLGSNYSTGPRTINLCVAAENWTEGTGEYEYNYSEGSNGADWLSSGIQNWSRPGSNCNAVLSSVDLPFRAPSATFESSRFLSFDLTNNLRSSNGFYLLPTGDDREDNFASRTHANSQMRPRLVVEYIVN